MCNSFDEFYICHRINEPLMFSFVEDIKCPNENYLTNLVFLGLLNVLFNLIISFIPWRLEFIKYKYIILILRNRNNNNNLLSYSLNSTQNITKIQNENIENSFKKIPTKLIIVCSNLNDNIITNINKNNNLKNKEKDIINNNEDSKEEKINSFRIYKSNRTSKKTEKGNNNKMKNGFSPNNFKNSFSERIILDTSQSITNKDCK